MLKACSYGVEEGEVTRFGTVAGQSTQYLNYLDNVFLMGGVTRHCWLG